MALLSGLGGALAEAPRFEFIPRHRPGGYPVRATAP